ncbi:amino acid ABC transporter permease [Pseudarthrobacter sp. AL07]|uniref:amino acid ABC transporter permease n=1 Tax=unclassified Pseudarthrobacter TaxID=2647000 RepID=UPI00249B2899|nr:MULTISPECIES: amino acid ABC transporter permease [unclassified Pseudarthrobacter]MDI3195813.1 amino acid ABC transporter permease [Pseudarthrobacter sp. AL20]MDI3209933.1 amino acid ABC transporter permease [Pseudarthrobacter sp. AL07]
MNTSMNGLAVPDVSVGQRSPEKVKKLKRPGRWASYIMMGLVAVLVIQSVATNPNFGWPIVGEYFASPRVLDGLVNTLQLTFIAMLLGVVLGVILAVMRLSTNPALYGAAGLYIWFFRGTPVFVQLLFWGFISALYPTLALGIPGAEPLFSTDTNSLITPVVAAILGLALNEAAYMAEIVRAGIVSVGKGQTEAAHALGMSNMRTLRRVILPQAMSVIVPPTANNVISMLKTTSLVSVLSFPELLYATQLIYAENFQTIPLLITASIWYLIVTTLMTIGQYYTERHYNKSTRAQGLSIMRRFIELQKRRGTNDAPAR